MLSHFFRAPSSSRCVKPAVDPEVSSALVPQQWGKGSSASLPMGSTAEPWDQGTASAMGLWEVGSGHSASSPWTIATALKGRVVGFFLLLVHLHKGRILNWKFSDFWPDSCDPHLERSSYINNKLFFQLFFKFTFSYFLWLPWAHDLHLPYCMQRDSLQCFLYLTSLSTKAGSHSVITFRVFFSSFWKKTTIWGNFKINGKIWSIEMLWTEAIRW